jgi:hypothetical protein
MNRGFCEAHALAAAIAGELFEPRPGSHPFARFEHEQREAPAAPERVALLPTLAPAPYHFQPVETPA